MLPIRKGLALHNLNQAGHCVQLVPATDSGHAKAPIAFHAPSHHQPVSWLKDVERHLLACISEAESGLQLADDIPGKKPCLTEQRNAQAVPFPNNMSLEV